MTPTGTTTANATCKHDTTSGIAYTYRMEVRNTSGSVLDSCDSNTTEFTCAFDGLPEGADDLTVVCLAFPPGDKPDAPVPPPVEKPLDLM